MRLFIFLLFSLVTLAFTQTVGSIQGKVVNSGTMEPLVGANVVVMDTNRGASTDADGNFKINNLPVGTYRIRVDYIGYESAIKTDIVVISARPAFLNIQLKETILVGEQVTVTAGYFVAEDKIQPSTIGLTREEIRRYPGGFEDIVRTVSTLPGVAINSAGGRNDLLVRGGGPSENLYLVNNVEVPNINHFGTQGTSSGSLSFINLDFIQDVAFSTGGFSAQYGDKMSAVLSLQTVDRIPEGFSSKWTLSATQYGMQLETPLANRGNLIFSARKSYLDIIFKAAGLPFVPVYTDYNIIANYQLTSRDKLFLFGFSAIDQVDRDQSTAENRVVNAGIMDNTQYQGVSGLNWRHTLKSGYVDVTAGLHLFRYDFSQADAEQVQYFSSQADEWENSFKIQHYWLAQKKLGVRSGIILKNIRNENTTTFADSIYDRNGNKVAIGDVGLLPLTALKTSMQKYAAFTELDWLLSPRLNINVGIRSDYYEFLNDALYVAPRASLQFKFTQKFSMRTSAGIYYQSPSNVWLVNDFNRNLKALQNNMAILGFDYLLRDDLRLSLETFYKHYRHLPSGTIPGVTDYLVITNTGTGFGGREDDFQSFGYVDLTSTARGNAFGGELLLQKKFSDIPLYGLMSFTMVKSRVTANNGITYPGQYDQRFIFNLTGGYILNSKWEFAGKFRYFTGVPFTTLYRPSENPVQPGITQNLPQDYLASRTGAGHHVDIRVDRYFNFPTWTLITYIDIQNIYNYKIPQKPSYDFWNDEIMNSSSIGILPSIGISIEF